MLCKDMIVLYANMILPREKTKAIVNRMEGYLEMYNMEFMNNIPGDDFSYYNNLLSYFGKDDILIIEDDIDAWMIDIDNIINCKHKDCTALMKLYPSRTGLDKIVFSARIGNENGYEWCTEKDEFADMAGLGFTKISLETQNKILDWFKSTPQHWRMMDHNISLHAGTKWHLHGEVDHIE